MATPSDDFCKNLMNPMDPSTTKTSNSSLFSLDTDEDSLVLEATTLKTHDSQEKDLGRIDVEMPGSERRMVGKYLDRRRIRIPTRIPVEIDISNIPNNESNQVKEGIGKSFDNICHPSDSIGFFCGSQDEVIDKNERSKKTHRARDQIVSNKSNKISVNSPKDFLAKENSSIEKIMRHATAAVSSKPSSIKDELEALRNKKLAKNIHALFGAQKSNKKHSRSTPILTGGTFLNKQTEQIKELRNRKEESMMIGTSYGRAHHKNCPENNWTSGNKAELAALRNQQLATSFRKDLLETEQSDKGVHLSAGDAFFHKKYQQKKERHKRKKEESMKYLTSYGSKSDFFSPSRNQHELTALRNRHLIQILRKNLMSADLADDPAKLPRGDNFVLKQSHRLEDLIRKKDTTLNELRTKYQKKFPGSRLEQSPTIPNSLPGAFRVSSAPNIHPFFLHQQSIQEEWRQGKRYSMAFLHTYRGYCGNDMSLEETNLVQEQHDNEKSQTYEHNVEKSIDAEKNGEIFNDKTEQHAQTVGKLSLERMTNEITRIKVKTAAKKTEREIQRMLYHQEDDVNSTQTNSKVDSDDRNNQVEMIENEKSVDIFFGQEKSQVAKKSIWNEEGGDNEVNFVSNDRREERNDQDKCDSKFPEKCVIMEEDELDKVLQNVMKDGVSQQEEHDIRSNLLEEIRESSIMNTGKSNTKLRKSRIVPPNAVHLSKSKIKCDRERGTMTSKIVPPKVVNLARLNLAGTFWKVIPRTSNIGSTESIDQTKCDGTSSSSQKKILYSYDLNPVGCATPKKKSSFSTIRSKKPNARRKSFPSIRRRRRLLDEKSLDFPKGKSTCSSRKNSLARKSKSVSPNRVGKAVTNDMSYRNKCDLTRNACPLSPFRFRYSPNNSSVLLYRTPIDNRVEACNNKQWIVDLHCSRTGCERCLRLASREDRKKFEEVGHHYRICRVRGGCSRSCKLFPRSKEELPIRLCRKCFYDTHHLGKV